MSTTAPINIPPTTATATPHSGSAASQGTPKRTNKRTVISDNVSVIPDDPSSMRAIDNTEVLEMATQDIVKLLGLKVRAIYRWDSRPRHLV